MKRFTAAMTALVIASACTQTSAPSPATAQPVKAQTYDLGVDAKSPSLNIATLAYFPNALKVHPGDTVKFTSIDRGEPHTVTFGTLVDAAVAALAKAPAPAPNAPPPPPPQELAALPNLIGEPPKLEVSQAAAQPCFLASGKKPTANPACAKADQQQSEFTGEHAFYNSGYLGDGAVFSVKLADTLKPGTYAFMCLLHLGMTGKLTVVAKNETADTLEQVKAAAADSLSKKVAALQPAADAASKASPDKSAAGIGVPQAQDALATVFAPKSPSVPVGGSVTWTVFGPHNIAFNVPQDAVGIFVKQADGSLALNPKALAPANGPGAPPPPQGGPPPTAPILVDSGPWDGKGFRNSGLILSFPPVLYAYKVTFTQAGTYAFSCTIHPGMEGTVKVGQ